MYREDILRYAYALAKANDGGPGVDGESFEDIETAGLEEWLNGMRKDLHDKTYQPQPVQRKMISKAGGGERPRRSAQDAIRKVDELLHEGYTDIVDADLSKYPSKPGWGGS